jgi:hypothetical protein
MKTKLLVLGVLLAVIAGALIACEPSPSDGCPSGWTFVSTQGWWQDDKNGDGAVDFPQTTDRGFGGHIHEDFCFPVNQRVDGTIHFNVNLHSHQHFAGTGDKLDIGLAPGGDSMASAPAPDMKCGPKPAKCRATVGINLDTNKLPSGLQSLRFRYLPFNMPDGERLFISTELPVCVRASGCDGQVGGKGWGGFSDPYANARFNDNSLFGRALSGTVQVPVYTKGSINWSSVHVDAHFGDDDEGAVMFKQRGEVRSDVPLDTRWFSNGWHCFAIRADGKMNQSDRINTGIIEMPVAIDNGPNAPAGTGNGHGSCFPGSGDVLA